MMYRKLPPEWIERIKAELETIPVLKGKVFLTFEFNSDTAGQMNVMEVKKFSHDQLRIK
jgi:hypothetical protein